MDGPNTASIALEENAVSWGPVPQGSRKKQKMRVGQVMFKSVKKRHFPEYVGQVVVKDADGKVIVTKYSRGEMWVR